MAEEAVAYYTALADYDPEGQEGCLALATGDTVCVTNSEDEQWWFGHLHTDPAGTGAFPAAFVTPYDTDSALPGGASEAVEPEGGGALLYAAIADYDPGACVSHAPPSPTHFRAHRTESSRCGEQTGKRGACRSRRATWLC